jgi:hypothetical protein
MVQQSL